MCDIYHFIKIYVAMLKFLEIPSLVSGGGTLVISKLSLNRYLLLKYVKKNC